MQGLTETPTETIVATATPTAVAPVAVEVEEQKAGNIDNDTARLLTERFLRGTSERKPTAKKEKAVKAEPQAESTTVEEAKASTTSDPEPKKPTKSKAPKAVEVAPIDYERIGSEVAKAVRGERPEAAPEARPSVVTFLEDKKIAYLKRMEEANPEKYKDIASKYSDGLRKTAEYEKAWAKNHEGEVFDKADPQHDEFFENVAVDWEDADYIEAVSDVKADERTSKLRHELDTRDRARTLEPAIVKVGVDTARSLIEEVGGKDAAEAFSADGSFDEQKWKAFAAAEPAKAEVLKGAAMATKSITAELEKLSSGVVPFDHSSKLHRDINNFALLQERNMMAQSETDRVQDGKPFVDKKTFAAMDEKQRAKHWTFSSADLRYLIANDIRKDAEIAITAREAEFSQWAEAMGMSKKAVEAAKLAPSRQPIRASVKPVSPTTTTEPKSAAGKNSGQSVQQKAEDWFLNRQLNGSMK